MFEKLKDNWRSVLFAVALHVLIIALLIFGVQLVSDSSSKGNHGQRIVKATVANPESVNTDMPEAVSPAADEKPPEPAPPEPKESDTDAEEKAQAEAEAKQQAQAQAAQEKADAKARAEAQRKAKEKEQEKAREKAEAKRKAEKKAEAERQAKEEARKEAEAEAARKKAQAAEKAKEEARRKAEAEEKAREEAQRRAREEALRKKAAAAQAAREQALKDAITEESAGRQNAADNRALGRWAQAIQDKVEARWRRPPGARDISCNVQVTQLPNGSVTDVRLLGSCGGSAVDRSVEQAIRRASPLPKAPSSDLFEKTINFRFEPDK